MGNSDELDHEIIGAKKLALMAPTYKHLGANGALLNVSERQVHWRSEVVRGARAIGANVKNVVPFELWPAIAALKGS